MSLFDPDTPVPDFPPEIIAGINGVITQLRSLKLDAVPLGGEYRTRNVVRSYIQVFIRRCLTFLDAGHAEFHAGRTLVTQTCARANYENVAAFCDFASKVVPLIEGGNHVAIREFVEARTFATRIPSLLEVHGDKIKAQNILNQIDRMTTKYPEYRKAYDHLSDFVHPNGLGSFVHYANRDGTFSDEGNHPEWALTSLVASGFMLAFFHIAIADVERALEKLCSEPSA